MQFVLVRVDLRKQNLVARFTNASYDIIHNGETYVASGDMLQISEITDTYEVSTQGLTISLSGISNIQSSINLDAFLNAPIDVLIAEVPNGSNVASAVTYYHRGYCDTPVQKVDRDSGTTQIDVETQSVFKALDKRPEFLSCSYSAHAARHPGDKFMEFVANTTLGEETWKTN